MSNQEQSKVVAPRVGTRNRGACIRSDAQNWSIWLILDKKTFETKQGVSVCKFLRLRNVHLVQIHIAYNYVNDLFHK